MFKVRTLALFVGLSGFSVLPAFASMMRDAFTPGGAPLFKTARDKRPLRLVHHPFGTSSGTPGNSNSSGSGNPGGNTSAPDTPYLGPPNWLTLGSNSPFGLGDLNPQPNWGWGTTSGSRGQGSTFGPAFWPGGDPSNAFEKASDADGGGDPPNPAAYLSDPPSGAGMLTPTPEPEHLIYAAFAGLLIGGLIRTLRGPDPAK